MYLLVSTVVLASRARFCEYAAVGAVVAAGPDVGAPAGAVVAGAAGAVVAAGLGAAVGAGAVVGAAAGAVVAAGLAAAAVVAVGAAGAADEHALANSAPVASNVVTRRAWVRRLIRCGSP